MSDTKLPFATVTIDLQTYTDLVKAHHNLNLLLDAFYRGAIYQKFTDRIDPNLDFSKFVELLDPETYERTRNTLKEEEENG